MNTDLYVCPICPKQGLHTHWKHEVEHGIRCPCSDCGLFWSKEKKKATPPPRTLDIASQQAYFHSEMTKALFGVTKLKEILPHASLITDQTDTKYSVYAPKRSSRWTCDLCGIIDDIGAYNRYPRSVEGAFQESVTLIICSRCNHDLDRKPTRPDWRTRIKVWHLMLGIPTIFALHQLLV